MDVTNMIREYIFLRNRSLEGDLNQEETERMDILRRALMLSERKLKSDQIGEDPGKIRLSFYDGESIREIALDRLEEPVIDIELSAGVIDGYKIVVVDRERGPASVFRARVLGRSEMGPRWYRLELGNDILNLAKVTESRV